MIHSAAKPRTLFALLRGPVLPVLAVGILLRLAVLFGIDVFPTVANTWDSNFYHQTAASLASGEGYVFQDRPTAFFPPAFPAAISVAYRLFGPDPRTGQLLNVFFSILLILFAGLWAHRMWGMPAARRIVVVLALEPSQVIMPAFLMSEVLCGFSLAAGLWFSAGRGWLSAVGAGAATLVCGFTRGHGFLVTPFVLAMRGAREKGLITALTIVLIISGCGVGFWAARNQATLGKPVLVATNAGINLWLGNNPNATGGRADPPGGVPDTSDEIHNEQVSKQRALEFMKSNPGRAAMIVPLKVIRLWGFGPAVTYRAELKAKLGSLPGTLLVGLAQLFHAAVLIGLVMRFIKQRRRKLPWSRGDRAVLAVAAIWTLGHLPFLGGARYLFPIYACITALVLAPLAPQGDEKGTV